LKLDVRLVLHVPLVNGSLDGWTAFRRKDVQPITCCVSQAAMRNGPTDWRLRLTNNNVEVMTLAAVVRSEPRRSQPADELNRVAQA
jgi:hypothetical protein